MGSAHREWIVAACAVGALCVLAGCAPKRVSSGGVVIDPPSSPSTTADSGADASDVPVTRPADDLPPPEPLARSGTGTFPSRRTAPAAARSQVGERAVELARAQLGKPYQWGAAGPDRFDCSGLVQYVYSNLGIPLPRVSSQQASAGVHVDRKELAPGDLVFFRLNGNRIDHVGIYVGRGKFIHAPNKRRPVRMDSLNDSWWRRRFEGGRRVG